MRPWRLDHGLISNGRVLALVAPDTHVEWYCADRFDGPALFCGLLDRDRGGRFAIELKGCTHRTQRYRRDSLVLVTTLKGPDGAVVVEDVCPMDGSARLIRRVSPVSGRPRVRVAFDPRPDYGRASVSSSETPSGRRAGRFTLSSIGAPAVPASSDGWQAVDQPLTWVLAQDDDPIETTLLGDAVEHADAAWRAWLGQLDAGPEPLVRRSLLTLAALTYRPSGAMIAAATTSLPEAIGEPRNWDYRYCWVRDGAFAADALLQAGDRKSAERFLAFLRRAVGEDEPQPLYRVDGGSEIPESILSHLRGFEDTGPVRIGNAAATQTQHDSHGQIVWLADGIHRAGGVLPKDTLRWLWDRVEAANAARAVPDAGIWEFRDRPGRYTFSHLWCWVALDRGARLAEAHGEGARAARWRALAGQQRKMMLAAADRVGFFAQTLDGDDVDASSLAVAPLGLVPASDPRYRNTIDRCEDVLLVDGLMRRYVAHDDFGETTSTFSLCTLWWIEALALAGRRDEARAAYDRFVAHANPVGLFSEDIEPSTGRLLGNFPQAYTHIGLLAAHRALMGSPPKA